MMMQIGERLILIGMSLWTSLLIDGSNAMAISTAATVQKMLIPTDSATYLLNIDFLSAPDTILVAISLTLFPDIAALRLMKFTIAEKRRMSTTASMIFSVFLSALFRQLA